MYYVAAPKSSVLQQLSAKGLTMPQNAGSINTVMGERKEILPADALNKNKISTTNSSSSTGKTNTSSDQYKNSKITFHNTVSEDGILGETYSDFSIMNDGLDYVYVQVNNYGEPLNTDEFIVDAYKKEVDTYAFVETKNFTISSDKAAAYFKYFPPTTGEYRLSVYTKKSEWINDGHVKFLLKKEKNSEADSKEKTGSFYYAKSKINFTYDEANVLKPELYYKEFSIGKEGGFIYVVVNNDPEKMNTDQIIVDIWKKKAGKYDSFIETKKYNITNTLDYTYFKYTFYETGEYKISVYAKDETWINTAYVTMKKK